MISVTAERQAFWKGLAQKLKVGSINSEQMRILQTISGLSVRSGGPSTCTHDLLHGISELGNINSMHGECVSVDLLTVRSDDILGEGQPWLKVVDNDYKTPFAISKNSQKFLRQSDYDLYHCNALWMGINHDTCRIAREKHKPYIISPHGMLYPTALAVHYWKKWILLHLWYNKDIHNACCLHATCKQEAEYCRQFGYKGPIAVIPNAVVFPDGINEIFQEKYERIDKSTESSGQKKTIGFLGRLHPIKKVEQVLYAIDKVRGEGVDIRELISFQIMGKGLDDYEQWLKEEVRRLELEDCVEFVGFVSGKAKYERLSHLSALMVPSAQENFGMIVPEALICGTPVYASLGTPWSELNGDKSSTNRCGWWRDNAVETIAGVIKEILAMSDEELIAMGKSGRRLMEEKYEQLKVAGMMKQLYEWIIDDNLSPNHKPQFIYG